MELFISLSSRILKLLTSYYPRPQKELEAELEAIIYDLENGDSGSNGINGPPDLPMGLALPSAVAASEQVRASHNDNIIASVKRYPR